MTRELHLLKKDDLPGEIEIHTDLLSIVPSALSRKRALKTGRETQDPMEDEKGIKNCILCDPDRKHPGTSKGRVLIEDRVGCFDNDFPYLPGDQNVIYLWHSNPECREKCLHRFKLSDFSKTELYWLIKGAIKLGNKYPQPNKTSYDLMRMVAGFNLGKLAGQSIRHFHIQYGWEVVLDRRQISGTELALYFEELKYNDLILHEDERTMVIAPWTPKGQFALDIYFKGKYEIVKMDETDIRTLAVFGERIIKKYLDLGIQNLNIVFSNSPKDREIEPLVVHFVPRVNMTALYEISGVNVVDTPPQKIAEEFRRHDLSGHGVLNWANLLQEVDAFDPDQHFELRIEECMKQSPGTGNREKKHDQGKKKNRTDMEAPPKAAQKK